MTDTREALLTRTFVTLADSLVANYDLTDLLQTLVDRSTQLFDAADAGITLGDEPERLSVVASTSDRSRQLELDEIQLSEGPCLDAVRTGRVASAASLAEVRMQWPRFVHAMDRAGYRSAHAIPMRLRNRTVGALNFFRVQEGTLTTEDASAAQALADVATISMLQERLIADRTLVAEQLQRALNSRIAIEQAKGILAQAHGISVDDAFLLLRRHARSTQTRIADTARAVINGSLLIPAE